MQLLKITIEEATDAEVINVTEEDSAVTPLAEALICISFDSYLDQNGVFDSFYNPEDLCLFFRSLN